MISRLRSLLLPACLLLALAVGIYGLSQSRTVRERVLVWAESILSDALGKEVRIEAARLQPWTGSLELVGLRVARAQALADGVFFSAETIQARWSWTALLRRQLVLRRIVLAHPVLELSEQTAPTVAPPDLLPLLLQSRGLVGKGWELRIRRATVHDGRLTWTESNGSQSLLEGLEGEMRWDWVSGGAAVTTANLRAARIRLTRGETTRQLDRLSLEAKGTAEGLSISAAEFSMADGTVTIHGNIADLGQTPRLNLSLGIQAPLQDLLFALGVDRQIDGTVAVQGRLQGAWEQPV
ncbi:MAG TPA: hypothetical protein VN203_23435, partial [Candidatus Acidoferrum sp.]|nr:hypothetical protein [Candidatus Acidoferrum sp.]